MAEIKSATDQVSSLKETTNDIGLISILEKIRRLNDLNDPWSADIGALPLFATNMGYPLPFSRDDIKTTGVNDSFDLDPSEKYVRSMLDALPDWYKTKTTRNSIRTMMYSFGVIGDALYYYTKDYSDMLIPAVSQEEEQILGGTFEEIQLVQAELRNQLNVYTSRSVGFSNWVLSDYDNATMEEIMKYVPNEYFSTPHFKVFFDISTLSAIDEGTENEYIRRKKILSIMYKAIEIIKPINTVFDGMVGVLSNTLGIFLDPSVRNRRYIRLNNIG